MGDRGLRRLFYGKNQAEIAMPSGGVVRHQAGQNLSTLTLAYKKIQVIEVTRIGFHTGLRHTKTILSSQTQKKIRLKRFHFAE